MTCDEFARRIVELAMAAERERPRNLDTGEGMTEAIAWIRTAEELHALAARIRREAEPRRVYRVA